MGGENLEQAAARLSAAKALGRSDTLQRLFAFLVERSLAGSPPKEAEVAQAVFRIRADFDASMDASVRVGVHRLRRKLEEYYTGPGKHELFRLTIPKGEYRIVVQGPDAEAPPTEAVVVAASRPWWLWPAGFAVILSLNLLVWVAVIGARPSGDGLASVRRAEPWATLMSDSRPLVLVMGDYYFFGGAGPDGHVDRLMRNFGVNSAGELGTYRLQHPQVAAGYQDLDLHYLPAASAFAVRNILPLLAPTARARQRVRVVLASDVTPTMLKHGDIIYIGDLNGLGALRDPVFGGSRFSVGDSYDELIDSKTGRHFRRQAQGANPAAQQETDFGYFSAFMAPSGNHIVIVAGNGDLGLTQMSEAVTNPDDLSAIAKAAGGAAAFEALYAVQGIGRSNLGGQLITASPLATDKIWAGRSAAPRFPAG